MRFVQRARHSLPETLLPVLVVLWLGLGGTAPTPVEAQQQPADNLIPEGEGRGWHRSALGSTPERNRVIVGLWAMHPFEPQFPELDGTRGVGGLYGHWFGATFVNSYDRRTFILGVERNWVDLRRGAVGLGAGYRVGIITGYDERLIGIARHMPVLPFGGLLLWGQLGPVGIDTYYVYRAITLEASVVF